MRILRVLLVDDSEIIRRVMRSYLGEIPNVMIAGECADGSQVLSFLQNHAVDIIFMDVFMPQIDGFEATKIVKFHFPEIRIIGFSSEASEVVSNGMIQNGADQFICKFDMTLDVIQDALSTN